MPAEIMELFEYNNNCPGWWFLSKMLPVCTAGVNPDNHSSASAFLRG